MTFRKLVLKSGKTALAGKSAENNEELIRQVGREEIVLHTEKPGSPFVNIKAGRKEISKKDLREAAVFCSAYSQAWKKDKVKREVVVHWFNGEEIFKTKLMKTGTFGVKKARKINVKKSEIINFEESIKDGAD
ncbi:MAG: DUF814 domain-containing protein [Nanoarchaeota archaeon]|nr:DUF814 domain-containing protein [Nanoarchaeota archaeon]MBU4086148.1 DUF814 domain-containing protein [Nanoarchaeota archaeon]